MHGPINVKSPNNTSKWQMGFNSAFKGLKRAAVEYVYVCQDISVDSAVTAPPQALLSLSVQNPIAN
jgi:hypothetical protein